ncbi:hypothetical protein CH49_1985 [Yersinia enterocolitica]|nr:hypothetical protein CH49_1985 [Yersinia enterocolitica]CRY21330.1 Uncharacterised protein [Yersinia enterocolitica]
MKKQSVLLSLIFCSMMAMSLHSTAQAKELSSMMLLPICCSFTYPFWI